MSKKIKVGALFGGVLGTGVGLERAFGSDNVEHSFIVEYDKFCTQVNRFNSPDSLHLGDINKVVVSKLPKVDIITNTFPCQDLSIAGKQKGLIEGDRSSNFFKSLDIVNHCQPRIHLIENVPFHTQRKNYESFKILLTSLAEIGYGATIFFQLDSQFFGVPQRRKRLFLLSFRESDRSFAEGLSEQIQSFTESLCWYSEKSRNEGESDTRAVENKSRESGFQSVAIRTNNTKANGIGLSEETFNTLDSTNGQAIAFKPISFPSTGGSMDACYTEDFSGAIKVGSTKGGSPPAVCFQRAELRKHGKLTDFGQDVSPTLQASTGIGGDHETNVMEPKGFRLQRFGSGEYTEDNTSSTLKARDYKDVTDIVIQELYESHPNDSRITGPKEICPTIAQRWGTGGNNTPLVQRKNDVVIRRLTPVECCRLQSFPDDWNAWGINEKDEVVPISDSQRYRQMGNAVTCNVIEWIANQIKPIFNP